MIKREDLIKIGQFNKPHGIKGELSFTFTNDVFDESECSFLICEIDGIFVPFLIDSYRFRSDTTAFMKLEGVESEIQAKVFANLDVYFPKEYAEEQKEDGEISSWDYFIGYVMSDKNFGIIGEIIDVDETTINTLFVLNKEGLEDELLIPAAEDLILKIDPDNKMIYVDLPEGLIEIIK